MYNYTIPVLHVFWGAKLGCDQLPQVMTKFLPLRDRTELKPITYITPLWERKIRFN